MGGLDLGSQGERRRLITVAASALSQNQLIPARHHAATALVAWRALRSWRVGGFSGRPTLHAIACQGQLWDTGSVPQRDSNPCFSCDHVLASPYITFADVNSEKSRRD